LFSDKNVPYGGGKKKAEKGSIKVEKESEKNNCGIQSH
jgi:hypothetical protein